MSLTTVQNGNHDIGSTMPLIHFETCSIVLENSYHADRHRH